MPEPIPAEWLSAAALAIDARRRGSSSAQLAMAVLEAVVPLIRAERDVGSVTEWGIRRLHGFSKVPIVEHRGYSEQAARAALPAMRRLYPEAEVVYSRVGPWTPAPGEGEGNA